MSKYDASQFMARERLAFVKLISVVTHNVRYDEKMDICTKAIRARVITRRHTLDVHIDAYSERGEVERKPAAAMRKAWLREQRNEGAHELAAEGVLSERMKCDRILVDRRVSLELKLLSDFVETSRTRARMNSTCHSTTPTCTRTCRLQLIVPRYVQPDHGKLLQETLTEDS